MAQPASDPPDEKEADVVEVDSSTAPAAQGEKIKLSRKIVDDAYSDQWTNRRRMAWVSLISMSVFTALVLFTIPESRLKAAEYVLSWYYMASSTVICTYMGLSTWATISRYKA